MQDEPAWDSALWYLAAAGLKFPPLNSSVPSSLFFTTNLILSPCRWFNSSSDGEEEKRNKGNATNGYEVKGSAQSVSQHGDDVTFLSFLLSLSSSSSPAADRSAAALTASEAASGCRDYV